MATAKKKQVDKNGVKRPYPRRTLESALRVPRVIRAQNGGKPWNTEQVAKAIGVGAKTANFFYITAAARDFGLTEGTRDTPTISLHERGIRAVAPKEEGEDRIALREAVLSIPIFKQVLDHYNGLNLPESRFLGNALEQTFGLHPDTHDEFVDLLTKNCAFAGIGRDYDPATSGSGLANAPAVEVKPRRKQSGSEPICFIAMPFSEREDEHSTGFFNEVYESLIYPAATAAGFDVRTARRQGSDVIHATIVNELLEADLVIADLTEHNPNVLFELGVRVAADLPVALIRAAGTGAIFDVDNMLRVLEYNPDMWPSTVKKDLPRMQKHIEGAWAARDSAETFMKILKRQGRPATVG